MSVHRRATNKNKTKFTWGYWVTIPSNEFDNFGNQKRKQVSKMGFATKKEALKAEKDFLDNLNLGKIELNKNATFNDIIQFYINYAETDGQYSKGSIANYKGLNKNHLTMFSDVRIDKITPALIRFWRQSICKTASNYTINDCIKLMNSAFNYAKREKQIFSNPFEEVKKMPEPKKIRKRFSSKQLQELLFYCKKEMPEYYCIFALSFMTGMRVGEYSALMISDIDFINHLIYIDKQFTRGELKNRNKTKDSTRIVQISDMTVDIIKWHIQTYNIKQGFLFKDTNGNPVSATWVRRKFIKLLELNGYTRDYCRVHDLRGQYVDLMHSCGIPTEYISRQVGHSNTSTTSNIYTQILKEVPLEANKRMDEKIFNINV